MAIVSSGALILSDTSPSFARSDYYPRVGLELTAKFASYGAIYRNQLWVYVVVNKRAKATARLPLKVYRREKEGRQEVRDDPYAQLLRRPNPSHDPFFFWLWTSSTLDVTGEAIWLKIRGSGRRVVELYPVHPSLIDVKKYPVDESGKVLPFSNVDPTKTRTQTFYAHYGTAANVASQMPVYLIPEEDVVHFRTYNPDNTIRGLSPLEPLRQTILNEDSTRRAAESFWKNGARPGVALTHPKTLSLEAAQRLRENWDALHAGVDRTGNTAVLEEGMKPEIIPLNMEEAQYIATRRINREEVCACWDVPPPAVGIHDRSTFNNVQELLRAVYRDTMPPHLGLMESVMDHQLRPEFAEDDLYAEFLMDEVLRGTFEERAEKIQAAINSGTLTPNEARALDNRPALEGGERGFINSAIIPITDTSSRTSPIVPANDDSTKKPPAAPPAPKGLSALEVRALMGRIGHASSLDQIDRRRLCDGLNDMAGFVSQALDDAGSVTELKTLIKAL